MGVQRCQNLARESIYWPNINNDIHIMVSKCDTCRKYQNSNPKEELLPHEIVTIPWYKIGCDLFEFNTKMYLLVVDYYSKFVEIDILSSGYNSNQVITKLKSIYARHGIPAIFVSDNGPPFNSKEFSDFCRDWGIERITSSPYLPRSNGLAERTIQTVKKMLYKCHDDSSDPYTALLQLRTTRKGKFPSPSEILMGRILRTKLPCLSENLTQKLVDTDKISKEIVRQREKMSKSFNKSTVKLQPVQVGEKVMFKRTPTSVWYPGKVLSYCKEPRSYIIQDQDGKTLRRNRQHIKKSFDKIMKT